MRMELVPVKQQDGCNNKGPRTFSTPYGSPQNKHNIILEKKEI